MASQCGQRVKRRRGVGHKVRVSYACVADPEMGEGSLPPMVGVMRVETKEELKALSASTEEGQ